MKFIFLILLFLIGCSQSSSNSTTTQQPNPTETCAELPTNVTIDPASVCSSSSGEWTSYTVNIESKMAYQSCRGTERDHYVDQNDFNANEGTSSVSGISITSKNDYVVTSTCASGSTIYVSGGVTTNYLYIWKKEP